MGWYAKSFEGVDIYINDKRLNKKQKATYLNWPGIPYFMLFPNSFKRVFLRKLLKNPVTAFQIPFILLKYLLHKKQNKQIRELLFKEENDKKKIPIDKLKIKDVKRNIIIETTNIPLCYETVQFYHDSVLINQYNVSSKKIKDKIVFDAGANFGEFAIYCSRLGAKKVYAFEPVTETFERLEKQIELNNLKGKIIPIKMALGDKNKTVKIYFSKPEDYAATIGGHGTNFETITVIKLDDFCRKEKITNVSFIKMDVEGYEENVLNGSTEIITSNKPILSFSAYHKPTDKKVLPALVKSLRPDYNIRLIKRGEEDFYCD